MNVRSRPIRRKFTFFWVNFRLMFSSTIFGSRQAEHVFQTVADYPLPRPQCLFLAHVR